MKPENNMIRGAVCFTLVLFLHVTVCGQPPAGPDSTPRISKDASFRSLEGKSIKLSDYERKVVVLAIWATWCYPCLRAVEELKELPAAVPKDSIAVIALSTEAAESAESVVRQSVETLGIKYPVGWLSQISASQLLAEKEPAIPQIFVIRDGVIVKRFIGWNKSDTFPELIDAVKAALTTKP